MLRVARLVKAAARRTGARDRDGAARARRVRSWRRAAVSWPALGGGHGVAAGAALLTGLGLGAAVVLVMRIAFLLALTPKVASVLAALALRSPPCTRCGARGAPKRIASTITLAIAAQVSIAIAFTALSARGRRRSGRGARAGRRWRCLPRLRPRIAHFPEQTPPPRSADQRSACSSRATLGCGPHFDGRGALIPAP
jgi:hypothetical protein